MLNKVGSARLDDVQTGVSFIGMGEIEDCGLSY